MILDKLYKEIPELKEQYVLFENCLCDTSLKMKYIRYVAFASAIALKEKELITLVEEKLGKITSLEKKAIYLATSRMAVTNPYFMARNIKHLNAGGTLDSLDMSVISNHKIEDEISYHYACIAISSINSGFVCFNSHLHSLKAHSQKDEALDQALRLTASLQALKQQLFNQSI